MGNSHVLRADMPRAQLPCSTRVLVMLLRTCCVQTAKPESHDTSNHVRLMKLPERNARQRREPTPQQVFLSNFNSSTVQQDARLLVDALEAAFRYQLLACRLSSAAGPAAPHALARSSRPDVVVNVASKKSSSITRLQVTTKDGRTSRRATA